MLCVRIVCSLSGVGVVLILQKQELAGEAKAARMYRDEIETLKVQVPICVHVHVHWGGMYCM